MPIRNWSASTPQEGLPSAVSSHNGSRDVGPSSAVPPSVDKNGNKNCTNQRSGAENSAEASSSRGLFGGMEIVRTRHRKSAGTTAGSRTPRDESLPSAQQVKEYNPLMESSAGASPFFMRFELSPAAVRDEVEAPQVTQMRQRLERFFEEYVPSKLSQVERTIKKFMGREEELFTRLVAIYGPEPRELKASSLPKGENRIPSGTASEAESAFDFISSAAKNQSHEKRKGAAAEAPSLAGGLPFMHGETEEVPSRQMSREADHTPLDSVSKPKNALGPAASRRIGRPSSSFDFLSTPAFAAAQMAPLHATEEKEEEVAQSAEYRETEAAERPPVYRNVLELDESKKGNKKGKDTTENTGKVPCNMKHRRSGEKSSCCAKTEETDDVSESETIWDRQRREIRELQDEVLLARANLSHVLDEIRTSIEQRRDCMTTISKLENRIEECVAQEAFEEADHLSGDLEQLRIHVKELDKAPVRLLTSLGQQRDATVGMVRSLAKLLQKHRQELIDSKDEEDRRVRKFIEEVTFSLETRKGRVSTAMERAERVKKSAMREQKSLLERKTSLREKTLKQNEGLRELQGQLLNEKMGIDAEIATLEAKLAKLRQASAEKEAELQDVTSNLRRMEAKQESMENDIDSLIKEEEDRMHRAAADLEQLQQESDVLHAETIEFDTKRELLLSELQDGVTRIDSYEQRRTLLETETLSNLQLYTNSVVELLRLRNAGRGVLFTSPSLISSEADACAGVAEEEESPVLHINRLEKQLSAINADDETCEALVVSLGVQLTEMRNKIPLLELAKKNAAQAMRFKEAQLKADEIRRLTASIAETAAAAEDAQERIRANALKRSSLQQQMVDERSKAAERVREFLTRYHDTLEAAVTATSASASPNVLQLPEEDQGHDELAEAMQLLIATLQQECSDVLVPEGEEEMAMANEPLEDMPEEIKTEKMDEDLDVQEVQDASEGTREQ
ncbi:hypothetical protein C3747_23g343 [Trypanosoma cruzi]|uniref:Uncharacterized protein n=2 Tax=Trypanosoma cruzi TaxID=5693 RepID=Q4DPY9_TRYCC|nr:hypothetical protein, conserved [Trypanosoma cruzi]EAN94600.1 hypothetical protein, conserved [Trypanosoma cruzi]PWV16370.1 hypothetical protein C3747_23g343 [Trypanosoma cruzi]RNC47088.1 hypothetical protein TcCL_NonESM03096 [Trypanosoma cruzi]|eukprot:XP_816451.1 hypothetical protein [Trypanosoma cruzi strain CL Brener]